MTNLAGVSEKVRGGARNVWLAGLGAFATVQDGVKAVSGQLVEKGRKFEDEKGGFYKDAAKIVTDRVNTAYGKAEGFVTAGVKGALGRLGVPTRQEVQNLTASVEKLTGKVEALKA